jgi:KUP system potassium uptake protein
MAGQARSAPVALVHNLRYNKVLHRHVVVLTATTEPVPHVSGEGCRTVSRLADGIYQLTVRYGFMEDPDVPDALRAAKEDGLEMDVDDVAFFLGRETLIRHLAGWHGAVARGAVRPDDPQCRRTDCVLQAAAAPGRRARRAGGTVTVGQATRHV